MKRQLRLLTRTRTVGVAAPEFAEWKERVCGIPLEHIRGRSGKLKFEIFGGGTVLLILPGVDLIDPKEAQPIGIQRHTDRRPILALGALFPTHEK